jgi:hypothetical protein
MLDRIALPKIDAYPAHGPPDAPRVFIAPCHDRCTGDVMITSHGEQYGDATGESAALLGNDLHGNDRVVLLIDGQVPWRALAVVIGALGNAGVHHLALAFTAGKTHATAPGPSSIDAQLRAFDAKEEADLERDPGGTLDRTINRGGPPPFIAAVYKDCPQAPKLIGDITSERVPSDNKLQAIAAKLPAAVVACECKIEVNALERLLWRLFGRDRDPLVAWVDVELAKGGATFDAPVTATWATMHDKLVVASRGKPLAF